MNETAKPLKVFIIAGEASGDQLGAEYIKNLKKVYSGNLEIAGVGGVHMGEQGLQSLFPMEELSVMGIAEILPKIFGLLKRISQTAKAIDAFRPDLVITIDSPDFCFRVVKKVRKSGKVKAKFIHYVAPTVWAWREKRAFKIAKLYDGIMCLFPFEAPYFEKAGMKAEYVGHPVMKIDFDSISQKKARDDLGIADEDEVLCVLFGSRKGELKRQGSIFAKVAQQWLRENENRTVVALTLPHLEKDVRALCKDSRDQIVITSNASDKNKVFIASDKALAVSGTIGLELAVADLPHIIGYKMNGLTFAIVKRMVRVAYAHLANIIVNRPIVPEYLQDKCTVEDLFSGLKNLDIQAQKKGFEELRQVLSPKKIEKPGQDPATRFSLKLLEQD